MNRRIYNTVMAGYLLGWVCESDWQDYCMGILFQIMEDNKEVFIRLKDR